MAKLAHHRRMSAILTQQTAGLALHGRRASSLKPGRVRERAIDAACFVLSLAAAGALAMVLLTAAELPSLAPPPPGAIAASPPVDHG